MKLFRNIATHWASAFGFFCVAALLAGCQSDRTFEDFPDPNVPATGAPGTSVSVYSDVFEIGDVVQITYAGISSTPPLAPYIEAVKEDGTIRPPMLERPIVAVKKKPGELQNELQGLYNNILRNVTVTVRP